MPIIKRKGKHLIQSKTGKILGTFDTREEAVKRLGQIQFFKARKVGPKKKKI